MWESRFVDTLFIQNSTQKLFLGYQWHVELSVAVIYMLLLVGTCLHTNWSITKCYGMYKRRLTLSEEILSQVYEL